MSRPLILSASLSSFIHIGILFFALALPISNVSFDIERAQQSIEVGFVAPIVKENYAKEEPKDSLDIVKQVQEEDNTADILKKEQEQAKDKALEEAKEKLIAKEVKLPMQDTALQQGAITKARPDYLHNSPPIYPRAAREKGYEGTVVLNVEVLPSGKSSEIRTGQSSGYHILDNAAQEAVKKWTFRSAKIANLPVKAWVEIPVTFKLNEMSKVLIEER